MIKWTWKLLLIVAAGLACSSPAPAADFARWTSFDLADVTPPQPKGAERAAVLTMASAEEEALPRPVPPEADAADVEDADLIKRTVRVTEQRAKPLQWKDVDQLEYTFQALNLIDLAQTATCVSNGRCVEGNPILGRNPSIGALVGLKLGTGLLHFAATRWLLAEHPKSVKPFLWSSIVLQGGVVGWNMQFMF